MRSGRRLLAPPSWLRLPRRTARLRLTVLYGGLFLAAGAGLLAVTFWLVDRATTGAAAASAGQFVSVPGSACKVHWTRLPGAVRPSRNFIFQVRATNPVPGARVPAPCRALLQVQLAALHQVHAVDLHALVYESAIALAVMAAIAVALGWLMAGRVLRPLRAITTTARRISASSLHERLALDGPDDEFTELAGTLDDLLGRLEASFEAQRHFVASASHELRTPLTLDRTLLQVALRDPGTTVEQWRLTGREVLESGQQQERLLEALLTLATSEGGPGHREPVDLAEVTYAGLPAAQSRIERDRLRVETSISPAPVLGDPDLIDRLVANLLDNAVRHNLPGGTVEISTAVRDGRAVLAVASSGLVIPPAEVDRLFEPFQRLETARTSDGSGHGLGLSIVRAIAAAHGAVLTADAPPDGGLRIEVGFPLSDSHAQG